MPESALAETARARGAVPTDVDGWRVPAHFGDPAAEHRALAGGVAIVDLAYHDRCRVTGGDRGDFLQGMLTADVRGLSAGEGRHALVLSDQGRVVADVLALVGAGATMLDGVAVAVANAVAGLGRYVVADDVELETVGPAEHVTGLFGPGAAGALAGLGVEAPDAAYAHRTAGSGARAVEIVRVPRPGAGGYLCRTRAADAPAWWSRCVGQGGATPAGHDAYELWRIESGVPRYGRDVTAETLALEVPFDDAIAFGKGCYLGQEVVERVTARGHVNRRLAALAIDEGAAPPPAGARLFAADRDVGWITSAAWSWPRSRALALGYVRREHLGAGIRLAVGAPDATVHASVTPIAS